MVRAGCRRRARGSPFLWHGRTARVAPPTSANGKWHFIPYDVTSNEGILLQDWSSRPALRSWGEMGASYV